MIEGTLDIFWENNSTPTATRRYRVSFLRYSGFEGGPVPYKQFVGEEALFGYLVGLMDPGMADERRRERVREWVLQLHSKTSLSLPNMILTEQQASEFARAATA